MINKRRFNVEFLEDRCVPATLTWVGNVDSDWDTAGNWRLASGAVSGAAPTAGDNVYFNSSGVSNCIISNGSGTKYCDSIFLSLTFGHEFRELGELCVMGN